MDTTALRDWATEHGTDVEVGADRRLGLTSKLIRFRRNAVPTIAVGSDADAKTRINAVLDGIAWSLARHLDDQRLDLIIGLPDPERQTSSQREQLGALGTLITALHDGPNVGLFGIDDQGVVAELNVSAATFTTGKPSEWAALLQTAAGSQVVGLAAELVDSIGHPAVALYPKLSSKSTGQPWQIRLDGLDIGRVGSASGMLRLATTNLDAPGRPRDQWRDIVVEPSRPFVQSSLDDIVTTIQQLIDEFSTGSGGVLAHGQPEHGLEAHVLSGRLPLSTSTGLPLRLAVNVDDGVLRAAQFPTLWGNVASPARYLDALLADDAGRPWAIELKDQFAAGGHGAYLRAGIGQAVLYRHYIRTVTELSPWFRRHGLDHTRCQAALAFPTAKTAASTIVEQHRDLAGRFGVDVLEFARP